MKPTAKVNRVLCGANPRLRVLTVTATKQNKMIDFPHLFKVYRLLSAGQYLLFSPLRITGVSWSLTTAIAMANAGSIQGRWRTDPFISHSLFLFFVRSLVHWFFIFIFFLFLIIYLFIYRFLPCIRDCI